MFRHMKIGLRMAVGFSIVFAFMIAIIVINLNQISINEEKFYRIIEINNVRLTLANLLIEDALQMHNIVQKLLLAKHVNAPEEKIQGLLDEHETLQKRINSYIPEIKKLVTVTDKEGFNVLIAAETAQSIALDIDDQVIALALAGNLADAAAVVESKADPVLEQWIAGLYQIIDHNKERNDRRYAQALEACKTATTSMWVLGIAEILFSVLIVFWLTLSITRPLGVAIHSANKVASGDLSVDTNTNEERRDEMGALARAFSKMVTALKANRDEVERQDWLKSGLARLGRVSLGEQDLVTLASKVIAELSSTVDARIGAIYIADEVDQDEFLLLGSYAYSDRKNISNRFKRGEGVVGQAALEKQRIVVKNMPQDYLKISSGLGECSPEFVCAMPILHEDEVKGVIEIGLLKELTELQLEYLKQAMSAIAISVESIRGSSNLAKVLEKSQRLTEELQAQQEELRATNEALAKQTRILQTSEEELKAQQEELQAANEELEEKSQRLERKNTT